MTIDEYVEKAKKEIDGMAKLFKDNHEMAPERWLLEMEEDDWMDQEFAIRFS
jgi:hypothetical protein